MMCYHKNRLRIVFWHIFRLKLRAVQIVFNNEDDATDAFENRFDAEMDGRKLFLDFVGEKSRFGRRGRGRGGPRGGFRGNRGSFRGGYILLKKRK